MASPHPNRSRLAVALALGVFVAVLGLVLRAPVGWFGDGLVRASYDSLHQLRGTDTAALDDCPVVIVYLDLNSFKLKELDPAQPWPRRLHAQLLDHLTAAGAKAVVFDIIFSEPGPDAAADREFAEAMRRNGRVILAGESNEDASHVTSEQENWARLSTLVLPADLFRTNAVAWGVASHIIDDDYVVRRYLAGFTSQVQPSLTWAAAEWLPLPVTKKENAVRAANEFRIRYYGPALVLPNVGYATALNPAELPPGFFRDKIVFIGARPMAEQFGSRQDEFRNPFHSWGHKELFMPGVEVHATELLNLVRGDSLRRLAPGAEAAWLLLAAALFGGGLIWLRPVRATVAAWVGAGAVLGLATAGFAKGLWFPWLIVVGAQIPVALGGAVLFHSIEWYRARRRFEARIREQAALIDKAHDAILVQALDGKILYANASAERLYGWKLGELQQAGALAELFALDTEVAKRARGVTLESGEWDGELRQQTKSGRIVIVASRWTLIRDPDGKPKELLLINSDITAQKELEAQFLRTQRMNTIGTLAGGMAHDLNNALAPILMGTQLLRRRATDNESRELLSLMETNTHRGADMVRQVLLFARGRGGEFERLALGAVVSELEKLVRETFPKHIAVESFVPSDLWPVRGNPTQLHQVLLNLCVNARDAMPSGGKLSFVTDNVELSEAEAATILDGKAGEFVSLAVADTGAGMAPEVRAKIFEPFFTTKGEGLGTGIGLATVLRIVKAHAGFLRVESEPGQGTTFEVFLPRASETASSEVAAPAEELVRGNGELVLVADDEKAIRELMKSELTSFGYRVLVATNGAEAVALFREHADEVRLLITDNAMPMMDGRAVIAALRALQPGLPVIFTSGEGGGEELEGVAQLSKPFALDELLGAIHRSITRPVR